MRLILLVGAVLAAPVQAGEDDPLASLRFLEGACWRAEIPGGAQADYQCAASMVGGHFLRASHFVHGTDPEYSGETIYYWDGETQEIRFIYFTSTGATSRGSVRFDEAGTGFVDERYVLSSGSVVELKGSITRPGEGLYEAKVRRRESADWSEATTMTFHRLPAQCRTLEEVRARCLQSAQGEER